MAHLAVCLAASLVAGVGLGGCAAQRPSLTPRQLGELREHEVQQLRTEVVVLSAKVVRRMQAEQDEAEAARARGETPEPPTLDVLAISGGGDWGAFGAGVLRGWRKLQGADAMPQFDVVTGVSTGALIAPFAFLGDDSSIEQIVNLYSNPRDSWIELRDLFVFLPWRQSFMSTEGLRGDVEAQLSPEMIQRIAGEAAKGRSLLIGTTNLDLGTTRVWRLGEETRRVSSAEDAERVYDILMASAAIPGVFPPVVIDGALYVDGGVTSNVLLGANLRADESIVGSWRRTFPGRPMPRMRFWIIVNNTLADEPSIVKPTWPSITSKSLLVSTRSATRAMLQAFLLQAELLRRTEGVEIEARFLQVPDDFKPPVEGSFQAPTMRELVRLGEELGSDPQNWRTALRQYEAREIPSDEPAQSGR